jgi:hypothetical protein
MGAFLGTLVAVGTLLVLYKQGAFSLSGLFNPSTPPGTTSTNATNQNAISTVQVPTPATPAAPSPAVQPQTIVAQGTAVVAAETTVFSGVQKAFGCNSASNQSNPICEGLAIGSALVSVLTAVFFSASAKRAKEAKAENSAVAAALPGWDQAIAGIATGYNAGGLTVAQAQNLLMLQLANYWSEVTPQIQPGRNGCNGGNSCPGSPNPSASNVTNEGGANYCSGAIGAACCVGCADLNLSTANLMWAVAQADKTKTTQNAFIQTVFGSKYGGVNRAAYLVYFDGSD